LEYVLLLVVTVLGRRLERTWVLKLEGASEYVLLLAAMASEDALLSVVMASVRKSGPRSEHVLLLAAIASGWTSEPRSGHAWLQRVMMSERLSEKTLAPSLGHVLFLGVKASERKSASTSALR
jgi:hypothetical protein